jgi:4-hydroxyphenylpyruvate dioxygenase-like putative hemolysin
MGDITHEQHDRIQAELRQHLEGFDSGMKEAIRRVDAMIALERARPDGAGAASVEALERVRVALGIDGYDRVNLYLNDEYGALRSEVRRSDRDRKAAEAAIMKVT